MARLPRLEVPGLPHLLLQRAHNFGTLTADDGDAQVWRAALHQASRDQTVAVHGYGLWPEGFLLLLTPAAPGGLSLLMQSVGRRYGAHFNRRHGRSGSLWDGRFRTTVIQPGAAVLEALLMVESESGWRALARARRGPDGSPGAEPSRAPLWSSRAHHLGLARDALVQDAREFWALGNTPFERESRWAQCLEAGLGRDATTRLSAAVDKGWVLADEAFQAELAATTGRRVTPLARGRPRKRAGLAGSPAQPSANGREAAAGAPSAAETDRAASRSPHTRAP